jgi:hypothetical protein
MTSVRFRNCSDIGREDDDDLYARAQPGRERGLQPDGPALSQAGSITVLGG